MKEFLQIQICQLVTWTMEESGVKFKSVLKRMGGDVFVDLSVIGEIEHLKIFDKGGRICLTMATMPVTSM